MNGFIRNTPELETACREIDGVSVALDTEFVWKRTYRPKLGIVQLAGRDGKCNAIDCLFCTNPSALGKIIADGSVMKILHDARQDLEHLWHYTGAKPENVFDTQLAAAFAGFPAGIGLQKLLVESIGVNLPKTETLTDWTQRPLTDAQLEYALDDVKYLHGLRDDLISRMKNFGTFDWFRAESAKYDSPTLYDDPEPGLSWLKVKTGKTRLDGIGFAVLRAIAAQREIHARKWDLPKLWLGDDTSLAIIAIDAAKKGHGAKISSAEVKFNHRLRQSFKRDVLAAEYAKAANEALMLPESEWPANPHLQYDDEVLEATDQAMTWLKTRAQEIHIDATIVANRATLTAFIDNADDDSNPLASGWRYEVAGRHIEENFALA